VTEFHETTVRVRYAETDQLGIVYHANYFVWFEIGRVELIRHLGISYKKMELEDDCHIVVADVHCRYHHPARYDQELRVRTRIAEAQSRTIHFAYEIRDKESGRLLTTGDTTCVVCGRDGRPKALPEKYRKVFGVISAKSTERV